MKSNHFIKKLLIGSLAMAMCACTIVSENIYAADADYKVTIEGKNVEEGHTFEIYQVFTGDLYVNKENKAVLSNIQWGQGVNSSSLLQALKNEDAFKEGSSNLFANCVTARDVAEVVDNFEDDATRAKTFADLVGAHLSEKASGAFTYSSGKYTVSGLSAGYYFIKDKDGSLAGKDSAYTRYILKVANDVTITPKTTKPTVDKSLSENENVDVASHAVNESFQYYLTAALPESTEYDNYEKYLLKFTDTLSSGLTFEQIDKVEVDGITLTAQDYIVAGVEKGDAGATWTLTIEDVKKIDKVDLTDGAEVKVAYSVHLNKDAETTVRSESGENGGNSNKVKLTYSNNPNWDGEGSTGETPFDDTFVFTFEVDNTKYAITQEEQKEILAGAGFNLFDSEGTEVSLIYDSTISAYRPIGDGESAADHMESAVGTGKFDMKGLKPGTYTLRETITPSGYNTCDDITIIINPKLSENADGQSATATFAEDTQNMANDVINIHGSILPRTGSQAIVILSTAAVILLVVGIVISRPKKKED